MLCEKCGTVIPTGSETCPNCGTPAPKMIDQTPIPDFSEMSSPVSEVVPQEEVINGSESPEDLNYSQVGSVETSPAIQPTDIIQEVVPVEEFVPNEANTVEEIQPVPEAALESSSEEVVPEVSGTMAQDVVPPTVQSNDMVQEVTPVEEFVPNEVNTVEEIQPVPEATSESSSEEVVPEVSGTMAQDVVPPTVQSNDMVQEVTPVEEFVPNEVNTVEEIRPVPEAASESSSEEVVPEVNEPTMQGGIPLATGAVVEPAPVMEQPVDELEVNVALQENNTTWTDEEEPEEKKVVHMPTEPQPVVKAQEPSTPMEKPDLLKGMNEPTPQEYAELEKKRIAREKTNRTVQMINKIALLLVGIVIVGIVGFFGYQYFLVPKETTQPYSYDAYTFQIDQNYKVTEQETGFVIEAKDQSASMSVQVLPDSYIAFENGYLSNQEAFINQMKLQYGVDAVKRVEQKNIEGQSFITITRTTDADSSYIIYTTTPDDKIILATYVPQDQILNQSQADQMSRNLLYITQNEK